MKSLIVYKSKTGFTKRYAQWIQESTKFDMQDYDHLDRASLSEYDFIIFGSRVHAGRVDGLTKFKNLVAVCPHIRLAVFATGGTPNEAEDVVNKIWNDSFTQGELRAIPHFYMQSGLDYKTMKTGDRLLMKALAKILAGKKDKDSTEAGCEKAIGSSYDHSSKEYMIPLLEYIRTLQESEKNNPVS